jgi:hypothetical protein
MPNNEILAMFIANILCICFRIIRYVCILENFKYICILNLQRALIQKALAIMVSWIVYWTNPTVVL